MNSIPTKARTSHPQTIASSSPAFAAIGQKIGLVVGLTCLAGFLVDVLVFGTPVNLFSIEWRIRFLQQAGDRSIILFFAAALLLYSAYNQHRLKRAIAFTSLTLGVAFLISCTLVIRDSLVAKEQMVLNISSQAQQAQTKIDRTQDNEAFASQVTPEQLQQVSQQLSTQATVLKDNARRGIVKSGMASVGNLLVIGIGFIGLGRLGFIRSR